MHMRFVIAFLCISTLSYATQLEPGHPRLPSLIILALMLSVEPPGPAQPPAHAMPTPYSSRALGTKLEHIDVSVPRALLRRRTGWSLARWPRQEIIERGSCWWS